MLMRVNIVGCLSCMVDLFVIFDDEVSLCGRVVDVFDRFADTILNGF